MLKTAGEKIRLSKGMPVWLTAYFSTAIEETKIQCNVAIDERK